MEQVESEEIPRASDKGKGEGSFNWSLKRLGGYGNISFTLVVTEKKKPKKYFMKCFSKNKIEWLSTDVSFIKHIVFWRRRKRAPALPRLISAFCVSRVKFQGHLRVGVVYALIQYLKQQRQK